jgi:hypothetical protein
MVPSPRSASHRSPITHTIYQAAWMHVRPGSPFWRGPTPGVAHLPGAIKPSGPVQPFDTIYHPCTVRPFRRLSPWRGLTSSAPTFLAVSTLMRSPSLPPRGPPF